MVVLHLRHGKKIFDDWASRKIKWVAMDTETQPKAAWPDSKSTLIRGRMDIRVFSMCYMGESYCFPTDLVDTQYPTIFSWMRLLNESLLNKLPNLRVVFHNANYDVEPLREAGMQKVKFWDTLISCWITNQNEDKSLKVRAPYFGRYIRDTRSVNFDNLRELAEYAEGDVLATDEFYQMHANGKVVRKPEVKLILPSGKPLYQKIAPLPSGEIVVEEEKLTPFHRLFLEYQEFPVLESTMRAEKNGIPIDVKALREAREKCKADIAKWKREIYRLAGRKFNIGSGPQKVSVLQEMGVPLERRTAKGALSVKYDYLVPLMKYPIVKALVEYAKVTKLYQVYLGPKGLKYYVRPETKCIHPTLNTVGAVTGRSSSSGPNMQTIPSRNDRYGIKAVFSHVHMS